jgi:hypothetical protein
MARQKIQPQNDFNINVCFMLYIEAFLVKPLVVLSLFMCFNLSIFNQLKIIIKNKVQEKINVAI